MPPTGTRQNLHLIVSTSWMYKIIKTKALLALNFRHFNCANFMLWPPELSNTTGLPLTIN
jgi:hypothetical protein